LHCVPSNITTRLRELEGQLGVALFNRERHRLLVTPEGRLLYRHARRLLALADETAALFAGDQAQGALRVGALDVALANHLPQRLARYRRESPGVELHIRPEHSLLLERLLMEGELDLIVT
ncbi:LysR family transcriptional regulator, partial [Klebsiella pneumoniae]|uniref:LysR family transcriptional regulator n=1 Tax=Klebsiella pneumoniae TaxID=573 RepID=UPI001E5FFC09